MTWDEHNKNSPSTQLTDNPSHKFRQNDHSTQGRKVPEHTELARHCLFALVRMFAPPKCHTTEHHPKRQTMWRIARMHIRVTVC